VTPARQKLRVPTRGRDDGAGDIDSMLRSLAEQAHSVVMEAPTPAPPATSRSQAQAVIEAQASSLEAQAVALATQASALLTHAQQLRTAAHSLRAATSHL